MTAQQQFTQESIAKAVRRRVLSSPLILYPGVASVLSGLAAALFASPVTVGLAVASPVLLLAGWQFEKHLRSHAYSLAYLAEANQKLQAERAARTAQLVERLRLLHSRQGIHQIKLFNHAFQNFQEILGEKFSPQELTYGRYLGIAEQVFLASLDNLERVCLALKSVSTVDAAELEERIRELAKEDDTSAREESATLRQRLQILKEQTDLAETLLLQNEKALTELDHVTAKVASVVTEKGRAELDLEQAMEELRRLAERAEKYESI